MAVHIPVAHVSGLATFDPFYFMSTTLRKTPFFLGYVYKESVTSTDDFSVKEVTFNLKLAECMQISALDRLLGNRGFRLLQVFCIHSASFKLNVTSFTEKSSVEVTDSLYT